VSKPVAGQGSDPPPFTYVDLLLLCCLQVRLLCITGLNSAVESQTSDQQLARLCHLLNTGTAVLWSIQYYK
jgi:hypothetical protein